MTDEEAEANAISDPDNLPLSAEKFAAAKKMLGITIISGR
jgi:putative transcriptional regulator